MESQFSRTALLIGTDALDRLWGKRIALFGAGGVGGFAAEALIRAGVGALDVFDNDTINESNLNRQIIALHSTLGMSKVDAIKARLNDISPNAQIGARQLSRFCRLDAESERLLEMAATRWGLSMRGRARVMKLARTIADLDASGDIQSKHVAEALQFRMGGMGRG